LARSVNGWHYWLALAVLAADNAESVHSTPSQWRIGYGRIGGPGFCRSGVL
jgi:hypothetical protein